jgi:hypothetical protein
MMMVPTSAHTSNPPYSFTLETPQNPKAERREQYLQNQMYQIQQELHDLQGIVHNPTGNRDAEITRDTDMTRALEQMESMRAEIDWLRQHHASDWAQGLFDEPPPGYGQ